VILGLSISPLREILEEPGAELMAFLRVKLDAVDVVSLHGGTEVVAVPGDCQDILGPMTLEVIGMEEIESAAGLTASLPVP
jgi:hypothetical protein